VGGSGLGLSFYFLCWRGKGAAGREKKTRFKEYEKIRNVSLCLRGQGARPEKTFYISTRKQGKKREGGEERTKQQRTTAGAGGIRDKHASKPQAKRRSE